MTQLILDGDPTVFVATPIGPNDFFSRYITEEESDSVEYLMIGPEEALLECRPFIREHKETLAGRGDGWATVLVTLKPNVNLRDVRRIVEAVQGGLSENRPVDFA